jgi:hypothetical protein
MDESLDNIYKYIFWHFMTHMTATAGITKHGQAAADALLQEFCQLDSKTFLNHLTHLRSPPVRSEKPFALLTLSNRSVLAS